MRRPIGFAALAGTLLLAACAETPMGPTVPAMPGPNTSFSQFQNDQAVCRNFAAQAVRDQAQGANLRGLGTAALATGLGAGLGAAIGGGQGAGIGAAAGALVHLAESGDSVRGWGESKMQHTAEIGSPPAVAGESGVDSLCESPPCLEREGEPCRQRRPHRFNFRLTMNAN